jgi:hypothetical protein
MEKSSLVIFDLAVLFCQIPNMQNLLFPIKKKGCLISEAASWFIGNPDFSVFNYL